MDSLRPFLTASVALHALAVAALPLIRLISPRKSPAACAGRRTEYRRGIVDSQKRKILYDNAVKFFGEP